MEVERNGRHFQYKEGGSPLAFLHLFPPTFPSASSVSYKSAGALIVSSPHHLFESFLSPAPIFFYDHLGDGKGGAPIKPRMMTSHTDGWGLRIRSYGQGIRASPAAELSYELPTARTLVQTVGIAPAPDLSYNGGVR